jgi:hypothetical protein
MTAFSSQHRLPRLFGIDSAAAFSAALPIDFPFTAPASLAPSMLLSTVQTT